MIFGYKMIQMIFWDGFARLRCGGGSVDSVHFGLMVLTRISMATSFILMAVQKKTPGLEFCCLFPLIYSLVCQILNLESLESWRMQENAGQVFILTKCDMVIPKSLAKVATIVLEDIKSIPKSSDLDDLNWHRCHQRLFEALTSQNHLAGCCKLHVFFMEVFSLLTLKGLQLADCER